MFKNLVVTALRNLKKQKFYTLVNLFGLAVGLAYFAEIAVLEDLHFNADRFHENAGRIYGVIQVNDSGNDAEAHSAFNPGPLLQALRNEFPEIEDGTRIMPAGRLIVRYEDKIFYETRVRFVDANFLSFFTFHLVSGNRATALSQPYSAVISQDTAEKYFGRADPIGRVLSINQKVNVTVTGVARNLYEDSSIRFDMLVPMEAARPFFQAMDDWNTSGPSTFLRLAKAGDVRQLEAKFPSFVTKSFSDSPGSPKRLSLFPLLDFRLKSLKPVRINTFLWRQEKEVIYMQLASAVIVLLITCLSFMILATSRNMKRAKEVAMRKVIGAGRMELVKQFLTESVVMALLALPLALLMYAITFPMMTAYMGQSKDIPLWNHPFLFKYLLGLTVLVGIFAGSYPAFILSAFKPEKVLKKEMTSGKKGSRLRKILVVSQFSLAIFLIMWTMLFKKQFDHFMAVDFGYDRDRVIAVSFKNVPPDTLEVLKKELGRYPGTISVAAATGLPGSWGPEQSVIPEGKNESRGWMVNAYGVDFGFVETVGIKMAQGRSFSRTFNDKNSLIINETMVRRIGWTQPLGRQITMGGEKRTVVGVARDFQFRTAAFGLAPAVLYLESKEFNWLLLKFSSDQRFAVMLDHLKKTWNEYVVDYPFEWITLDDYFHDIYSWMERVFYIMRILNTIIVFVAALSLFGLVSYSVERRTKEIGIRKVLGASVPGIIRLLSGEFVMLVILANILAIPFSAWVTQRLMRMQISFSLVRLDAGMCALTIVMTLAATILAISWQIWRAARANPAESLHYE